MNIADEIKSKCNIVDVIGRVVSLKKAGSNYKGLCPFHNEKTPSFVVSETKQIFTCFGCGKTGDVIKFVEDYYNLDFIEAAEMLANEYGIELDLSRGDPREKEELFEINRQAARFFYKALREKQNPGLPYMKNRGISDEILNKFGIGYADEEWTSLTDHLTGLGFDSKRLVALGLSSEKNGRVYDKFRGRVIFPILNTSGKVIGFGGRILGDGQPKYLNSQESGIFLKKNNLYGLNLAREYITRDDRIILVEGYMDVISLYQGGVRNVCASLGTALTEEQARLIKRYTKNVVLSYDADEAGQVAAVRGLDILYKEGCRARVLKVTEGKDPDEFIKSQGKAAFDELVENAVPSGDFKIGRVRDKYNLENQQQRIDFVTEAVDVIRGMKPVEADIYIKKLASETGVSEGAIRMEYDNSPNVPLHNSQPAPEEEQPEASGPPNPAQQDILKLMLLDPAYCNMSEDIVNIAFSQGAAGAIYRAIRAAVTDRDTVDINKVKDSLNQKEMEIFEGIQNRVIAAGKEENIFSDCILYLKKQMLEKELREIVMKLSLSDSETDQKIIEDLMSRQMEIQKQINSN